MTKLDLYIVHGADHTLRFNVKQADGTSAQDITGWQLKFTIKTGQATRIEKTPNLDDPTNGVCSVSFARSETLLLPKKVYPCDLWRIDAGSNVQLGYGNLEVTATARSES